MKSLLLIHDSLATKAMKLLNKTWPTWFTPTIKVNGFKMHATSWDRLIVLFIWKFGLAEAYELSMIRKLKKERMVSLDIGANIGFYALELSSTHGSHVKAYEPSPREAKALRRNLAANGVWNVSAYEVAVGERKGTATLAINDANRGDNRLLNDQFIEQRPGITTVNVISIDDFDISKVDIVKIDVQGHEISVLRGMKRTLENNYDVKVFIEFCPELLILAGNSPMEMLFELASHGFNIYRIDEKAKNIVVNTPDDLIAIAEKNGYVNLYCER